jgi:hypothetical protein
MRTYGEQPRQPLIKVVTRAHCAANRKLFKATNRLFTYVLGENVRELFLHFW